MSAAFRSLFAFWMGGAFAPQSTVTSHGQSMMVSAENNNMRVAEEVSSMRVPAEMI